MFNRQPTGDPGVQAEARALAVFTGNELREALASGRLEGSRNGT